MNETITVKLIGHDKSASVVEYYDDSIKAYRRVIVDSSLVNRAENFKAIPVPAEQLEYAIPYGIPWEFYVHQVLIQGEDIARILYSYGIYTKEDFERNPANVLAAVKEMATPVLSLLNQIVKGE